MTGKLADFSGSQRLVGAWLLAFSVATGLPAMAAPMAEIIQNPEIPEAMAFKSISIGNVSGASGAVVAQELETILLRARVQDRQVFRSVTRGGKADGVITGEVVEAAVSEERYSKTDSVCDRYKPLPADAGSFRKMFGKECEISRKVEIPCLRRVARFGLAIRLADTQTSRTVYSDSISRSVKDEACNDESRALVSPDVLLGQARSAAMQRVRAAIVPTATRIPIELMERDAEMAGNHRQRFEGALRFAKEERMDRACDMFRELVDAYRTTSIALNYNLGFCEEVDGNAWNADGYYRQADKLTNEPNKLISTALERTKLAIKRLDAQGKLRPDLVASKGSAQLAKPAVQPMLPIAVSASGPIPPELLIEDKRVALVIGNSKYPTMPLLNPANDAADIAARLRKLKFDVIHTENAKLRDMDKAFDEFSRRLKPGGVALVYYAGHGIQVAGENWLVPVDAKLQDEREVSRQTFALNQIMDKLDASKSAINIIILDACRNDPFTRSWKRSTGGGGLATVQAPSGTLIAYSTAPGKTAEDGDGRNSPFTTALVKALEVPNLKLEDVFKTVGRNVMQMTASRQVPWNNSSVTGDFYFSASQVAAGTASAVPLAVTSSGPPATAKSPAQEPVSLPQATPRITVAEAPRSLVPAPAKPDVDQIYNETASSTECPSTMAGFFRTVCRENYKSKLCETHDAYGKASICPATRPSATSSY